MVWATTIPLASPNPELIRFGLQTLALPLIHTPLALASTGWESCQAHEPCLVTLSSELVDHLGQSLDPDQLASALQRQIQRVAGESFERGAECEVTTEHFRGETVLRLTLDELKMPMLPYLFLSHQRNGEWIGAGPYRLEEEDEEKILLTAVETGRCPSRVVIRHIEDERRILQRFLAGAVDLAVVPGHIQRLLAAGGSVGGDLEMPGTELALLFNSAHPALRDGTVRRCLLARLGPALEAARTRAYLEPPSSKPPHPSPDRYCNEILREALAPPIVVEMIADVDGLTLAHEAVLVTLSRLGHEVRAQRINLSMTGRPIEGHFRLTAWNPAHPLYPRAWFESGGALNSGQHSDPGLDALLARSAPMEELMERLGEQPAFVPFGAVSQAIVLSGRFAFDESWLEKTQGRWPALAIRPRDH